MCECVTEGGGEGGELLGRNHSTLAHECLM